jgi:hypothetical protein
MTISNCPETAQRSDAVWRGICAQLRDDPGYGLLTALSYDVSSGIVQRLYSSDEVAYPLGGTKKMGITPWGRKVLIKGECFLAQDEQGIKWAFPDHQLINSLGFGSAINIPVLYQGCVLGTLNLLHRAGFYKEAHVAPLKGSVGQLVPLFTISKSNTKKRGKAS